MKNIFFFVLIGLNTLGYAQDTLSKWTFGLVTGIDRNYTKIQVESTDYTQGIWDSLEVPVWRGMGGVRIGYNIRPNIEILTGINYANRGYSIDTLVDARLHNLKFHYRFFELPIGLHYGIKINEKNDILIGATLSARLLLSDKIVYQKLGQTAVFEMTNADANNRIQANVNALLGIRRHIANDAFISLYVNSIQAISPLSDGPVSRYLNSIGLQFALSKTI